MENRENEIEEEKKLNQGEIRREILKKTFKIKKGIYFFKKIKSKYDVTWVQTF